MLELSVYDGIPHLLTPVVTDPKKAIIALRWAVREMEDRYKKMAKLGVRNIDGFNARVAEAKAKGEVITRTVQTGFDKETGELSTRKRSWTSTPLPYIVVIVDEMADLMMVAGKEIEGAIQRLAQMARAAGIHVILATQRPSVDVITGTIKANFPTRISFQVTSKIDSRTILGEMGAEQLLGQGDMLHMARRRPHRSRARPLRLGRGGRAGRGPPQTSGQARLSGGRHGRGRRGAGAGGDAGLRRERDGARIGRALRPGGLDRAAAQEGVDLLHPAAAADRLQPGRLDHGANGEGRDRRPCQPCGQARDPDRNGWSRRGLRLAADRTGTRERASAQPLAVGAVCRSQLISTPCPREYSLLPRGFFEAIQSQLTPHRMQVGADCSSASVPAHLHEHFAEVTPFQHANECLRGILQPLDYILAVLDLSCPEPGAHLAPELTRLGDAKSRTMKPRNVRRLLRIVRISSGVRSGPGGRSVSL